MSINDKHIEHRPADDTVVKIENVGDTEFPVDEQVTSSGSSKRTSA